jgi:AraC family transcriptional regulator, transcriptional activator of pobA
MLEKMKEKVRNIPMRDMLLPTIGNLPFDVRKLPPSADELSHIPQYVEIPHRHNYYEIICITAGESSHYIDFESYQLQPGSLSFISPGQVHFFNIHASIRGYFIIFANDFLIFSPTNDMVMYEASFFHRVRESPVLRLTENQAAKINTLIQTIYDEYHSEERDRASLLKAYLHILIVRAQRLYNAAPAKDGSANESSLVRRFMQLVSENLIREQSVRTYANRLGMSESHLSDTIKALTGLSPGWIIRQHIVLEAKRLLALTDLTVAEIGYTMNFEDPSYFGRFLRRETGLSPCKLRQHIREKYLLFREKSLSPEN